MHNMHERSTVTIGTVSRGATSKPLIFGTRFPRDSPRGEPGLERLGHAAARRPDILTVLGITAVQRWTGAGAQLGWYACGTAHTDRVAVAPGFRDEVAVSGHAVMVVTGQHPMAQSPLRPLAQRRLG